MISGINDDDQRCNGIVLNTDDPADAELLGALRADARIEFVDNVALVETGKRLASVSRLGIDFQKEAPAVIRAGGNGG